MFGAERLPIDHGSLPPWYQLGSLHLTLLFNADEPSPAEFPTHAMPILWLEVDDLTAAKQRFARCGVRVIQESDGQAMIVADPDGLVIEVWEKVQGERPSLPA